MIAWCSLPGSQVETAGGVHFKPFDGQRATELTVSINYRPPIGKAGDRIASWFGFDLEQILKQDLEQMQKSWKANPAKTQPQNQSPCSHDPIEPTAAPDYWPRRGRRK